MSDAVLMGLALGLAVITFILLVIQRERAIGLSIGEAYYQVALTPTWADSSIFVVMDEGKEVGRAHRCWISGSWNGCKKDGLWLYKGPEGSLITVLGHILQEETTDA